MPTRETLILLPGMFADGELWASQMEALNEMVNPVAMDLREDSVEQCADRVLRAAPSRFHLAGLSFGAHVAFEIMRRAPERVLRLALINCTARADSEEKVRFRQQWDRMIENGQFAAVLEMLLPLAIHQSPDTDPSLRGRLKDMALRFGEKGLASRNRAMMTRPDSRTTLASIQCPTLVVAGRQDRPVPLEEAQEVASGIGGAKFVILEKCGHLSPIEQPAAVTEALRDWLLEPTTSRPAFQSHESENSLLY